MCPEFVDFILGSFKLKKLNKSLNWFRLHNGIHWKFQLVFLFFLLITINDYIFLPWLHDFPIIEIEEHLHVSISGFQQHSIVQFELALVDSCEIIDALHLDFILSRDVEEIVDVDSLVVIVDNLLFVY